MINNNKMDHNQSSTYPHPPPYTIHPQNHQQQSTMMMPPVINQQPGKFKRMFSNFPIFLAINLIKLFRCSSYCACTKCTTGRTKSIDVDLSIMQTQCNDAFRVWVNDTYSSCRGCTLLTRVCSDDVYLNCYVVLFVGKYGLVKNAQH